MSIEGPTGSNKESLEEYIPLIEDTVSSYEEMKVYYVSLSWNTITVYLELTDAKLRERSGLMNVFDLETDVLDKLSFIKSEWLLLEIAAAENGPPAWSPVWVKLNANSSVCVYLR